jgi:hypothetical protein
MARKDLAGIAALAGLGMLMANKGKKGSKADRDVSDREDAREPEMAEEDPMEAANKRTERTLMPNQRGAAGTSETMFPSARPGGGGGARPAAAPVPPMRDSEAGMSRGTRNVPPAVSMAGAGRGGQGGPRAGEAEAYRQKQYEAAQAAAATPEGKAARQKQAESQAVEGVYPEANLVAPGLRTAQSIAKGLAGKFGGDSAKAASPFLKELPYGGAKQLPNAPTKQLPYDKAGAVNRAREARAASRNEEMLRENARRSGLDPDNMNPATAKLVRDRLGGDDFSLGMKRGGAVRGYASGGSVSSASRRADGIATKGKTRGKMC